MPEKVKFRRGNKSNIPKTFTDGEVLVTTDTNELFMDTSTKRIPLGAIRGSGINSEVHNDVENNEATYSHSSASNLHTKTGAENQSVIGQYNDPQPDSLFEVGNGTSNLARSNAFLVFKDGHAEIQTQGTTDNSIVSNKLLIEKINEVTTLAGLHLYDCFIDSATPQYGENAIVLDISQPPSGTILLCRLSSTTTTLYPVDVPRVVFTGSSLLLTFGDHGYWNGVNHTAYVNDIFALYVQNNDVLFAGMLNSTNVTNAEYAQVSVNIDDGELVIT